MTLKSKAHHEMTGAGLALAMTKEASVAMVATGGALLGGIVGYDSGRDNKLKRTLTGAGIGALGGAGLGHLMGKAGKAAGESAVELRNAQSTLNKNRLKAPKVTGADKARKRLYKFHKDTANRLQAEASEAAAKGNTEDVLSALKAFRYHTGKAMDYV
ncbi:MAG: hypothetical protein VXZ72_03945 [Chlamydiota bacterium]|nr:hypothetical protein [Chlamydiota bacterium]